MTNDRRRKRRLFEFLLIALLVLLALIGLMLDQASRPQGKLLTHAGRNWHRLEYGMPRSDVIEILGPPASIRRFVDDDGRKTVLTYLGEKEPLEVVLIGDDKQESVYGWEGFEGRTTSLEQEPSMFERVVGYWFTRK